jgi:NAD(P)-dependent dehydrogenase (short-subunit alcohol dehydrogenase family)
VTEGVYGISNFGLEGLSQIWAAELEDSPVQVKLVDPDDMNTAQRIATPATFVYLASDKAEHIHGQKIYL